MSTSSVPLVAGKNLLFKGGWIILLVADALMLLNHFGLIFYGKNSTLFVGWTAFNLYALLVLVYPFRHLEKWAWYTTWILPIVLLTGGLMAGTFTLIVLYSCFAVVCVLGLLLSMRDFFAGNQ